MARRNPEDDLQNSTTSRLAWVLSTRRTVGSISCCRFEPFAIRSCLRSESEVRGYYVLNTREKPGVAAVTAPGTFCIVAGLPGREFFNPEGGHPQEMGGIIRR
jgi:hypothetical protein